MRFGSGRTGLLQDSTGSVIVQDGHQDDNIQMQSLSEGLFKAWCFYAFVEDSEICIYIMISNCVIYILYINNKI